MLWEVVREAASRAGIEKLTPHDLRRYAECRIYAESECDASFGGLWNGPLIEVGLENNAA